MFEPPKILGDVFEALVGAIFLDGGISEVLRVYEPLLSPFILFTAKYSKRLFKEPKDECNSLANLMMIKPVWYKTDIEVDSIEAFMQAL